MDDLDKTRGAFGVASIQHARNGQDPTGKSWHGQESTPEWESSQKKKKKKERKEGTVRILQRFAERCTMHGPAYISNSTWWVFRLAWTLLFVTAFGLMVYHLYLVGKQYTSFGIKNKLSLGFSSLQFPAVTLCNVNPIRASKLTQLSGDLGRFIEQIDPSILGEIIDGLPRSSNSSSNSTTASPQPQQRRRRETTDDDDYDDDTQLDDIDFGNFSSGREDVDSEWYQDLDGYTDSWEKEGKDSDFSMLEQTFVELFSSENRSSRVRAGHQLKDMLLSCSFSGKTCYHQNFTLVTNVKFGNCYTLQYDKFISRSSGPRGGLELVLYLDTGEYIRAITPDDGLQVSVHPPRTVPFPQDDGMAVAAGSTTKLSLKLVHIARKDYPYGYCTDSRGYLQRYRIMYSTQVCVRICEQRQVHEACGCHDETAEEVNILLNVTTTLRPCRSRSDVECLKMALWKFQNGDFECGCYNPCSETKYLRTMTARPWPNTQYAEHLLVRTACRRMSPEKCERLKSKQSKDLSREFVKLNIFYEDLNYENITEEPDYEEAQFISDLGGTLGLWVGLSFLSVVEVVQLAMELIRCLCCSRGQPRVASK
ncbi:acid-sensing ion channel 2-like [Babylonia areolata]|uniref:acid-sensing ion channel 2-like n=1 Tax=Babylonia areolata TaxID=304850 RepID=UPI003FD30CD3